MPRKKPGKVNEKLLKPRPKRPHRKFYVNGKLEFSLFFDPTITDKKTILKNFFDDKLWKWHSKFFGLKVKNTKFSEDKMEVYITTNKPKKK